MSRPSHRRAVACSSVRTSSRFVRTPAEAILERDAVNLADQLFLPPRHELRDDAAEQNQAGDPFADREHARGADRHDVAVADRRRGHGAEMRSSGQTAQALRTGSPLDINAKLGDIVASSQ